MIEKIHIDGDIVNYRCAAAAENEDVNIACWQASEMMHRILHETNAVSYNCFLTGSDNFRYLLYPEYKANRKDVPKPKHYHAVREHLISEWNAKVVNGYEADDAMGMEQCLEPENSCIASIDKDMLMIPGLHYNFVKKEFITVSPLSGLRHFYYQLIMGDRTDNIFGFDGKTRDKVPKFLENDINAVMEMTDEEDMFDYVLGMYQGEIEKMIVNGKCLWIWRKENDIWIPPHEKTLDGGTT